MAESSHARSLHRPLTCREVGEGGGACEAARGRRSYADLHRTTCSPDDRDREPGFERLHVRDEPATGRPRGHHDALWRGLVNGRSTRSAPTTARPGTTRAQEAWPRRLHQDPERRPGIEERLQVLYPRRRPGPTSTSTPVRDGSTTGREIFGLYPRKGTIAIGSDADLVVWDPQRERTLRQSELHHAVDYTLYEGTAVRGAPRTVMLRGDLLVENETFIGGPGTGQFLRRRKYRGSNVRREPETSLTGFRAPRRYRIAPGGLHGRA